MVELVWDGKYDASGKRIAPLRVSLPFQTVETVNESAQERQRSLDLFAGRRDPEWRNRLIWGDKKYVLPALLDEFAGQVELVYIDPPFATGADFSLTRNVPESDTGFTKQPSVIEQKAYRDTWGRGLGSYLQWVYESVILLQDFLTETGSIYVHIGPNVNHLVRACLDEVFGAENFRSQIIWKRTTAHSDAVQGGRLHGRIHDVVLFYSRSDKWAWNQLHVPYDDAYVQSKYPSTEEGTGRRYGLWDMTGPGGAAKGNPAYEVMGVTRHWRYSKERMNELLEEGRVIQPSAGAVPRYKRYLDEMQGIPLQDVWTDISPVNSQAIEDSGYPTQKPETLLERILQTSTEENDLVLDCFCGSGTSAVVAEKLSRRWIGSDLSRFAVHTTRKRLLSVSGLRPFVVQNLGKYERQLWQVAEFGSAAEEATQAYRRFILGLYGAKPIQGYLWLHGVKGGAMVHVGTVDAPVTVGDVKQIVVEFRKATGTGEDAPKTSTVDVLGWDFAFELNEVARQEAAAASINMRFVRIPREVLDKRAVEQGDVKFFELAALGVTAKAKGRTVTVQLTEFVIPLDDVPDDIQRAVKDWTQWIDYWAVDWDNRADTFHNQWQSYRSREKPKLETASAHEYEAPGTYSVVVKVIDILGNDTTKTIEVEVG